MSFTADAAFSPFPARLTLRETALWSGAAAAVVATHLLAVYMYYANAPEPPAAEAMEQALTIDLAPVSISQPESVAAQAASPAEEPETIEPVEELVPLARETVETVEPVEPLAPVKPTETQTIAPAEQQTVEPKMAETVEAEPIEPAELAALPAETFEAEPIEPSELAALPPEEVEPTPVTPEEIVPSDPDQVVLPTANVPIPTPRPEPPVRTAEKPPKQAPTREARKEPPKRKQAASAAPSVRGGASRAPRIDPARWQTKVVAWLNRHKRYPSAARSRGEEGTANVTFTINSSGRVLSARIANSSGSRMLDEAALDMVRRASPVPAPPPQIARGSITLGVPVNFRIR